MLVPGFYLVSKVFRSSISNPQKQKQKKTEPSPGGGQQVDYDDFFHCR